MPNEILRAAGLPAAEEDFIGGRLIDVAGQ
jgi:hypothetical protein